MNSRGGDAPPPNSGDFLLRLSNFHPPPPPQQPAELLLQDPAVVAVGPSIPAFTLPHAAFPPPTNRPWNPTPPSPFPPFAPHNYFHQNPNPNPNLNPPDFSSPLNYASHQFNLHPIRDDARKLVSGQDQNLIFGSLTRDILRSDASSNRKGNVGNSRVEEGFGIDRRVSRFPVNGVAKGESSVPRSYEQERGGNNGGYRSAAAAAPPGFSSNVRNREHGRRNSDHNVDKGKGNSGNQLYKNDRLSKKLDSPGLPAGSSLRSASAFTIEESMTALHGGGRENGEELTSGGQGKMDRDRGRSEMDDLEDQLVGSLGLDDKSVEKSGKKKHHHDKDYRSDRRGQWIMGQRMRNIKSQTSCRRDINRLNAPFLAVFESLIPADEERVKQKQLLTLLERLVGKEWPEARLYLYGSCANSFGFSKSDIDVCLEMDLGDNGKSEVLLKLADILQSDNLENVQALTRARVPIVKLMDPITGISCDICVNNVLAVVNTKLLHDYAQIDVRLRQLAFIVKHWAKSRGINATYQGTLSSYAYVLMCIHFLQQRRPAILPCLQGMESTYSATVENVECAYFDQVEKLQNYGSRNGESIAQLVWAFFHYWAYCHDYANDVISVRAGCTLSKRAKEWTRRVGNDRHLICIEDPFEVSHDLGRVVDKYSIRVLREEFERAAEVMQHDPNPCVTLSEPYVAE